MVDSDVVRVFTSVNATQNSQKCGIPCFQDDVATQGGRRTSPITKCSQLQQTGGLGGLQVCFQIWKITAILRECFLRLLTVTSLTMAKLVCH